MANLRNCSLPLLAALTFSLSPLALAEDPALAPPATADVANEGVPPAAAEAPAPDTAGSLDSQAVTEKPAKKSKKKTKKHGKEKKKKKSSKKTSAKKHSKKKHKKHADY